MLLTRFTPCEGCIGRSLSLCGRLTDAQLSEFVTRGGRRQRRKRDILFRAGDPITNLFKIARGLVAVSRTLDATTTRAPFAST
jgi:CRP-like cAMP-binding protein